MTEHALTPTQASPRSAVLTLRSPYHTTVPAERKEVITTDLQVKLPEGCFCRLVSITELASFHHKSIGAGVINADFRGNLYVVLFNHSKYSYNISRGDKIALLICEKICHSEFDLV